MKPHFVPLHNALGLSALPHRRNRLSSLGKRKSEANSKAVLRGSVFSTEWTYQASTLGISHLPTVAGIVFEVCDVCIAGTEATQMRAFPKQIRASFPNSALLRQS